MTVRRTLPGAALGPLGLLLVITGCAPRAPEGAPSSPLTVEVATAVAPEGVERIRATGIIAHEREMALAFRTSGILTAAPLQSGAQVARGGLVARLDPTPVSAAALQTQAALERARRDLQRDRALLDKGFVSRQRVQDAETVAAAAEAAHRAATFDESSSILRSPSAAVVLERRAEPGEVVQAGQVVARLADLASPLLLRASLPDRDAARLHVGALAEVRVGETDQIIAGHVVRIGRQVDLRTGVVTVDIALPAGTPMLRSGQVAAADIRLPRAGEPGTRRLPVEALVRVEGPRAVVMVVDTRGRARRTAVEFVRFEDDAAALLRGLPPGAQVITAGAGLLDEGQPVRVARRRALGESAAAP